MKFLFTYSKVTLWKPSFSATFFAWSTWFSLMSLAITRLKYFARRNEFWPDPQPTSRAKSNGPEYFAIMIYGRYGVFPVKQCNNCIQHDLPFLSSIQLCEQSVQWAEQPGTWHKFPRGSSSRTVVSPSFPV